MFVRKQIEEGLLLFSFSFLTRTPCLPFPRTAPSYSINTSCSCNVPQNFRRVKSSELGELTLGSYFQFVKGRLPNARAELERGSPTLISTSSITAVVNTLYKAGHGEVRTEASVEQQRGSSLHPLLPLHVGCLAKVYWYFSCLFLLFFFHPIYYLRPSCPAPS